MSDLQIGLLCIGIAVVAIVLAYNKWQEIQFKRRAERDFRSRHSDVLFGGSQEGATATAVESTASLGERIEPALSSDEDPAPLESTEARQDSRQAANPSVGCLTDDIDYLVDVTVDVPLHGTAMIDAAVEHLASSPKSVRIEGLPENLDKWYAVVHECRYARFRAGMQLVDRRGRTSRAELQSFADSVVRVAQSIGGTAQAHDVEKATARAEVLDELCGEVDIQVAVHIAGGRFPGSKIRALAEAAGFTLESDGRFRHRDGEGRVLFELANDEATPFSSESMRNLASSSISLELDFPRAPGGDATFDRFRELAGHLANALGGEIVDDRRSKLTDASFAQIGKQLSALRKTMDANNISAGGPVALRLFS